MPFTNAEYSHVFILPSSITLFGIPSVVLSDLNLSTQYENSQKIYSLGFTSEFSKYTDHNFSLGYQLILQDSVLQFEFNYLSNKELLENQNLFKLRYETSEILVDNKNKFSLIYRDEGFFPELHTNVFKLGFHNSLSVTRKHSFSFSYNNELLLRAHSYTFAMRYDMWMSKTTTSEFRYRYYDKSFGESSYNIFQFRVLIDAVELRDNEFNFSYHYDYYQTVPYVFELPYHMRLSSTGTDNGIATFVENNGAIDFNLEISNADIIPGDYLMVVDSGSSYSSYFANFTVPETSDSDISLILYNRNGVRVAADFTTTTDGLSFDIEDVDTDSSLSLSAYNLKDDSYSIMFDAWPNWSTYIHETDKAYSRLFYLDSGNFKILPLQPSTCCLLSTSELCILPPYSEVDDIIDDSDTLKLEWQLVNTALWDVSQVGKNCSAGLTEEALRPNRTVSLLTAEIIGPGVLEFQWMIKSTGNDSLWFEIDDLLSVSITDEQDYITQIVDIPRGLYMVEWFYIKDETSSSSTDISSIDKITYKRS